MGVIMTILKKNKKLNCYIKPVKASGKELAKKAFPKCEKEENLNETLTLCTALMILRKKGIKLSKNDLKAASEKECFKSNFQEEKSDKFLLSTKKFREWIKKMSIPPEYMRITEYAKSKNLTYIYIYALARKKNIEMKYFGSGRGDLHININQIELILNKNKSKKISLNSENDKRKKVICYKARYNNDEGYIEFIRAKILYEYRLSDFLQAKSNFESIIGTDTLYNTVNINNI